MQVAQKIREELEEASDRIIYHFLIVLVEDFGETLFQLDSTWDKKVMNAGGSLFAFILGGAWFDTYLELAINIEYDRVGMVITGPEELVDELEQILDQSSALTPYNDNILDDWWFSRLIDTGGMLHMQISAQVDKLIQTDKSYIKQDGFRNHRQLVFKYMKKTEEPQDAGTDS